MKNSVRTALIAAAALAAVGAVLFGAACLLGARPAAVFSGDISLPAWIQTGSSHYRRWQNEYSPDGAYSLAADGISAVDIDWPAGKVDITVSGGEIAFSESAVPASEALRWGVEDGTLYIQYCAPGVNGPASGKDLSLKLPEELAGSLSALTFDGASADLTVSGVGADRFQFSGSSGKLSAAEMTAQTVSLDSSSGDLRFSGRYAELSASSGSGAVGIESTGEAEKTAVDTSSGDIRISGRTADADAETSSGAIGLDGDFDSVRAEAVSGFVSAASVSCPRELNVETSSGDVCLTLPKNSDFTLGFDSASGGFDSDLPLAAHGGEYVCGSGTGTFTVGTSSGSLQIRQG